MAVVARIAELLAAIIICPDCAVCGAQTIASRALCDGCERKLDSQAPAAVSLDELDSTWAARPYDGLARELVAAFKFRRLLPAARVAAQVVAAEAPPRALTGALVPVPPDPLRLAWRGFDPADLIAGELAALTGLPLQRCLCRRHGQRQVGRSRLARLTGPAVEITGPLPSQPILVDDVVTTGATLRACARTLRIAGSPQVRGLVFAASGTGPQDRFGNRARQA